MFGNPNSQKRLKRRRRRARTGQAHAERVRGRGRGGWGDASTSRAKFGREGAGTFQCPRPLYIGRNLTYPSRGTFQCRGSGPGRPHDTIPRPAPVVPSPTGPFLPFFGASDPKIFSNSGLRPEFGFWASEITGFSLDPSTFGFFLRAGPQCVLARSTRSRGRHCAAYNRRRRRARPASH